MPATAKQETDETRAKWASDIRASFDKIRKIRTFKDKVHDPTNLRSSHMALQRLFDEWVRLESAETVLAGACAVYGWMPTMLKSVGSDSEAFRKLLTPFLGAENEVAAAAHLISLASDDQELLLHHLNDSVVGSSKFLHFATSGKLPIWDSRVAQTFNVPPHQLKKTQHYLDYVDAVSMCVSNDEFIIPEQFSRFLFGEKPVQKVRAIEFGLYMIASERKETESE